jgi:CheY-like chemotaxis protein
MPDGDGCAMMRTIRARESGARRVPAVAMTAHVAEAAQRDAIDAGFDRYLTKPIDIDQLISTLARLVPSSTSGR